MAYSRFTSAGRFNSERPTPLGLIASGAIAGLIFEVVILVPLFIALRRRYQLRVMPFILIGSLAWFAVCFCLLLLLGIGPNGASATAVAMFLPGLVLVLAFWFIGGGRSVA